MSLEGVKDELVLLCGGMGGVGVVGWGRMGMVGVVGWEGHIATNCTYVHTYVTLSVRISAS